VERTGPLSLGQVQTLPVPGSVELGDEELELHPASGHTSDGMAIFARWCGVLCVGDYLSRVEIPWISKGGSVDDYRATLARLAPLVEAADTVVPGHGAPSESEAALRLLDEDVDYLDALERGEERPRLPPGRDSSFQRWIHSENLAHV
jgi:glyoxylase-like metal-dependent hydrolase (beta-lactamase superfamily II)